MLVAFKSTDVNTHSRFRLSYTVCAMACCAGVWPWHVFVSDVGFCHSAILSLASKCVGMIRCFRYSQSSEDRKRAQTQANRCAVSHDSPKPNSVSSAVSICHACSCVDETAVRVRACWRHVHAVIRTCTCCMCALCAYTCKCRAALHGVKQAQWRWKIHATARRN